MTTDLRLSRERDRKHTMWRSTCSFHSSFCSGRKFAFLPNKAIDPLPHPEFPGERLVVRNVLAPTPATRRLAWPLPSESRRSPDAAVSCRVAAPPAPCIPLRSGVLRIVGPTAGIDGDRQP